MANVAIQRLIGWAKNIFMLNFPILAARVIACQAKLEAMGYPPHIAQPQYGLWYNFCINGPRGEVKGVSTQPHADAKNLAIMMCVVFVYGKFNSKEKAWLVLWEAELIIEVPVGVLIYYPSALFTHFNVDMTDLKIVTTHDGAVPTQKTASALHGPRVTALTNWSVLASYTAISGSTKTLTVVCSTDGGSTFSAWGSIACGTGNFNHTFLQQLPKGHVVMAFRKHDHASDRSPTYYHITACMSTEGRKTWAFLSQVTECAATARNNRLWDILMNTLTDNGPTWPTTMTTVARGTMTGRDGMPGCTNILDGAAKPMCVFEKTEGHSDGIIAVKSVVTPDDGQTELFCSIMPALNRSPRHALAVLAVLR
ncbi:hypothetical protein GSI_11766 [Ganoderma sinense ZZ0214-1]|uniref:Sialidase domain-containing protein n=1 Tax=Ganoderma sinense ZZ0214-1 TaxID=1077348 RepID=A0A2G8RWX6_9APHY|nr:hypothetical protein GSI_11766 [Ganoderma sinense ZZ0214-1]